MLFLDDIIQATVTDLSVPVSKTYTYTIWELGYTAETAIFRGNIFLQAGQTRTTIDITDIVVGRRWSPTCLLKSEFYIHAHHPFMVGRYFVTINDGEQEKLSDEIDVVLAYRYPNRKNYLEFVPEYYIDATVDTPFMQGYSPISQQYILNPHIPFIQTSEYPLLFSWQHQRQQSQGILSIGMADGIEGIRTVLSPQIGDNVVSIPLSTIFRSAQTGEDQYQKHIIYEEAGQFWDYSTATQWIGDLQAYPNTIDIYADNGDLLYSVDVRPEDDFDIDVELDLTNVGWLYISHDKQMSDTHYITLSVDGTQMPSPTVRFQAHIKCGQYNDPRYTLTITNIAFIADTPGAHPVLNMYNSYGVLFKVADVDVCPARYYLAWQDRYGGFQSQPFDKIDTFSEDIERTDTHNYQHQRRPVNVQVTPKWQINSDWIQEPLYPLYESIFVSPYLLLYDSQEDKSYNVILTDTNYTEKTFKNQHKMFNLTLHLEEFKKQNITY